MPLLQNPYNRKKIKDIILGDVIRKLITGICWSIFSILIFDYDRAHAACTSPAGLKGEIIYNDDFDTLQFCDDTNWISMGGGSGGAGVTDGDKGDVTVSGSGSSWMIDDDVLDFTELSDTLTLDASTNIVVDGSNVFSITNTGTGNSFVVNDQASDTVTPFVIDAAGNVGINIAVPTEALDVVGRITSNSVLMKKVAGAAPPSSAGGGMLMATNRLLGRSSAGAGVAEEISIGSGLTLSAGRLSSSAGISDGDKGDITVSGSGAAWNIDSGAVALSDIQNIATARLLGRSTAGAGVVEELSIGSGLALASGILSASGGGPTAVQVFTANGTYTRSANVTKALVIAQAPGGGGGGGGTGSVSDGDGGTCGGAIGGGGGSGETRIAVVSPGSTVSVTVGSAGTGGNAGVNGTAAGDVVFTGLVTAKGGGLGTKGANASCSSPAPGAQGTTATGSGGALLAGMSPTAQYGRSTIFGTSGNPSNSNSPDASLGYGAGGVGGSSNYRASGGAPGFIIIIEF